MPEVQIIVPANWRTIAGRDLGSLTCDADTVGEALSWLAASHPQLAERLYGQDRQLASWVNVYLGEDDVRVLSGLDTPISGPAPLVIMPALAGG